MPLVSCQWCCAAGVVLCSVASAAWLQCAVGQSISQSVNQCVWEYLSILSSSSDDPLWADLKVYLPETASICLQRWRIQCAQACTPHRTRAIFTGGLEWTVGVGNPPLCLSRRKSFNSHICCWCSRGDSQLMSIPWVLWNPSPVSSVVSESKLKGIQIPCVGTKWSWQIWGPPVSNTGGMCIHSKAITARSQPLALLARGETSSRKTNSALKKYQLVECDSRFSITRTWINSGELRVFFYRWKPLLATSAVARSTPKLTWKLVFRMNWVSILKLSHDLHSSSRSLTDPAHRVLKRKNKRLPWSIKVWKLCLQIR